MIEEVVLNMNMPLLQKRYRFIQRIKEGSFCHILMVEDTFTRRRKVVKMMHKHCTTIGIQEAKRLMQLNEADLEGSMAIVRLQGTFSYRGHFCLLLEALQPLPLSLPIVSSEKRAEDIQIMKKISVQIVSALIFLKRHSLIHGNIKPENILCVKGKKIELIV
jgi:serine/threonine protein kinase